MNKTTFNATTGTALTFHTGRTYNCPQSIEYLRLTCDNGKLGLVAFYDQSREIAGIIDLEDCDDSQSEQSQLLAAYDGGEYESIADFQRIGLFGGDSVAMVVLMAQINHVQKIVDAFYEDNKEELATAFNALLEKSTEDGFSIEISQGAELVAVADAFEEWANYEARELKFVLLNGWTGSINSMTYAMGSSGGLVRGTHPGDLNPLEWVVNLWSDLYSELSDCVKIASKAIESNNDLEACEEDHDDHCDCGFDPAANDYDELYEFDQLAEKLSDFGDWLTEHVTE